MTQTSSDYGFPSIQVQWAISLRLNSMKQILPNQEKSTMSLISTLHSELLMLTVFPTLKGANGWTQGQSSPFIILNIFVAVNPVSFKIYASAKHLIRLICHMRSNQHYCCTNVARFVDTGTGLHPPETLMDVKINPCF